MWGRRVVKVGKGPLPFGTQVGVKTWFKNRAQKRTPSPRPFRAPLGTLGGHLGRNVVRKGFQNEVQMGAKRRLNIGAFKKHGKREFDTLFITFQPRRAIQKTQLFETVLGTMFSEKCRS